MLCLICALAIEYFNVINKLYVSRETIIQKDIYVAESDEMQCIVVKCGIGKLAANRCLNELLKVYSNIKFVFSVGIAGAISPLLKVGDIVVSNTIIDLCKQKKVEEFYSKCDIDRYLNISSGIHWGKIISSDTVINSESLKHELFNYYGGVCVEMESAGIIRVCKKKKIKFAAIKVISDYSNESAEKISYKVLFHVTDNLGIYVQGVIRKFTE